MIRKRETLTPSFKLWLEAKEKHVLGKGGVEILKAIQRYGSITEAARRAGVSYKYAWDRVSDMEDAFGEPFLQTRRGGRMGGGGAELTEVAVKFVKEYDRIEKHVSRVLKDKEYWETIGLRISARNRIKGIVKHVNKGDVTASVRIEVSLPASITAVITREAVEDLKIEPGDTVEAVIKATEVMIAKD